MNKMNNKGVTLVEIMVSMAIGALVVVAILRFMAIGTNTFHNSKQEVTVQSEAQTTMNQISNLVIDANRGVKEYSSYGAIYDKVLVIYNEDIIHMIFYHAGNQKLYYVKKNRVLVASGSEAIFVGSESEIQSVVATSAIDDKNIMAQYVNSFDVVADNFDMSGKLIGQDVKITLEIGYRSKTYPIYNKVSLRNKPLLNP